MSGDDWVKVALVEDAVAAEFLLTLKQPKPTAPPPPPSTSASEKPALSFEWRVRQRRSKPVVVQKIKKTPRASPTTPLSWSGATSISGGEGFEAEESSRLSPPPKSSDISRSKVIGPSEGSSVKRCRKKKTLAQLKEEEVVLEKERRQLKRELASVRDNLERERSRNENFKKMKQQQQPSRDSCPEAKKEPTVGKFVLPDLNLPLEDNLSAV